jgi:hypothetical protein
LEVIVNNSFLAQKQMESPDWDGGSETLWELVELVSRLRLYDHKKAGLLVAAAKNCETV